MGRHRQIGPGRGRGLGLAALVLALALALPSCGGDDERGDPGPATSTTASTTAVAAGAVDAEQVVRALLEGGSPLAADAEAGPEEARCVAERLVGDMTAEELERIGLPEGFDGLTSILDDEDATERFFATLFDCLDLVPLLVEQLGDLPEAQARCVAERVAVDPDVRTLFLVGTTDGTTPGGPGRWDDELDGLSAHEDACA